jgi:hypothetical protein
MYPRKNIEFINSEACHNLKCRMPTRRAVANRMETFTSAVSLLNF